MTAPRLATTRPAALTGTIGQGGLNRPHDVALVQALLGARRDKRGRPYLRDHVTGKYDQATANALMGYRMDMRDQNIRRPLARSGPMLNKLAQGQALAVPEGTATPYKIATLAEPGPIKGPAAGLLSAERKVALKQVMKEFTRDWGIAFDVEVKAATENLPPRSGASELFESRPLVAHFTPRNLWVRLPRNLSAVPSNAQFRARAKALYEIVEADLKARCAEAFGIKDPVDVKIQQGLKNDLACVVRTDLEGVEALAQFYLADFRKKGFTLAVRFLENYLKANGESIELSRNEALELDDIQDAVQKNIERFKEKNLIAPNHGNPAFSPVEGISKDPKLTVKTFEDHWKADIVFSMAEFGFLFVLGSRVGTMSGSLAFGPGNSSVISTGSFLLQRKGDRITVTVTVTHVWSDPGYDFNKNAPFHEESLILERHGKAKPFHWKAEWEDGILGELQIENAFSPNATRRWVTFEVHPTS